MTPSYPQFTQTGMEEYNQAAVTAAAVSQAPTAVVSDPQAQFKEQVAYSQASITPNGVEQQTVSKVFSCVSIFPYFCTSVWVDLLD